MVTRLADGGKAGRTHRQCQTPSQRERESPRFGGRDETKREKTRKKGGRSGKKAVEKVRKERKRKEKEEDRGEERVAHRRGKECKEKTG